jgi:hypothetical protein
MRFPGALANVWWQGRGQGAFPQQTGPLIGNNLPGFTGQPDHPAGLAPGPYTGGQLGGSGDGTIGADPRAAKVQPSPRTVSLQPSWQETFVRNGSDANDTLITRDRHAYWDTGNQKTGTDPWSSGGIPNSRNNPLIAGPRPDLRLVQRSLSWQIGSDHTGNQDDLTRPYTWLGEQIGAWTPVYGGVPGLYQPYGSRGGIPFPIVSPAEQGTPGDGPHLVFSGPPHGLHSQTPWKGSAQYLRRVMSTPQTRPVRFDRPANSPQAGQSYSQTVQPQAATRPNPAPAGGWMSNTIGGGVVYQGGRGWAGRPPGGAF